MACGPTRRSPLRDGVTLAVALGLATACSQGSSGDDDDDSAGESGESGAPHGGTGGTTSGGTGGTTSGGTGGTTSGGTGGTTSGGTGGGSSGGTSFPATCQHGCGTVDDCPSPDLYSCDAGLCVYLGCDGDAECATISPDTVCRPFPFYGYSTCVPTCSTVADCSLSSPPFDEDNYECLEGGCVHHGCNDDAECAAYAADTVCYDAPGTYPSCSRGCAVPGDCIILDSLPAYSVPERYQCVSGKCVYSGCESDAECNVENLASTYVCRVFEP